MTLRYLLAWLLLAVVAIANGVLRQATYGRILPELAAHQISTVTGIVFTGIVIWLLSRTWPLGSADEARTIGLVWLALTVAFEFGFGHFVAGHSWSRLLADYDLSRGRLWTLFLAWLAVSPWIFFKFGRARS